MSLCFEEIFLCTKNCEYMEQLARNSNIGGYNTFKRRIDDFWMHQDILSDYKVDLDLI